LPLGWSTLPYNITHDGWDEVPYVTAIFLMSMLTLSVAIYLSCNWLTLSIQLNLVQSIYRFWTRHCKQNKIVQNKL
jgi:hypothetical protein